MCVLINELVHHWRDYTQTQGYGAAHSSIEPGNIVRPSPARTQPSCLFGNDMSSPGLSFALMM
ncbi:MAG: hypothetical protein K8R50_10775 [Betaproteobacteria bacterium]|nr:hypothetical protein [Betaproteobacteria bacterium]